MPKQVETVAFIEKDAISGAALLSLACDRIIMLPTARIGDAGEIVMGGRRQISIHGSKKS